MENKLIEVKGLKQYFDVSVSPFKTVKLKAVDGISFAIGKGEALGLVGESGSGKTTTGRSILGLYPITEGEIYYKSKLLLTNLDIYEFKKRATMVFQDPYSSLDPRMTVMDIIGEPMDIHNLYATKKERREKILSLMERVGLRKEYASRYAHEFSGGQRQRIGIARALSTDPEFIVCDEPVSALDVSIQAQIINMFDDIRKKMDLTYLFIAHDLLVVRHICDDIAVMYLGKIVEKGRSDAVCDRPLHPYTKALMSAVPIPDPKIAKNSKRIVLEGDIPSPLDSPGGCPFHTRCPIACDICRYKMPDFIELETDHFVACHRARESN